MTLSFFDPVMAVLLIPICSAAMLAALPGYRLTARLNVIASLATFAWREYFRAGDLDDLERAVRDPGDLLMTSAHPQGGNALGDVVDEDFRVRGFKNLYLCDASVFPTSVHVNPQLTVMGLAEYAAGRIL